MCRAIDAAYEIDEVKDIRDKALALEVYAQQARNFEAEQRAGQVRVRAERRAGQLLAILEKAKGTRGQLDRPHRRLRAPLQAPAEEEASSSWQASKAALRTNQRC
jgi:hypothetical protein